MEVNLIAHTKLSEHFLGKMVLNGFREDSGKIVGYHAIRTCYSPVKPSTLLSTEADKYFNSEASDGKGGSDADRLIRHIVKSGHTSTLEHITFTFLVEGVSRATLAQLTRHRIGWSYSVQSQRYVSFHDGSKAGQFDYVVPPSIEKNAEAETVFEIAMTQIQSAYNLLRKLKVPAEDARYVLPNAAGCNITMTANLRSLLDFYSKRNSDTHAQWEIAVLAERLKELVVDAEDWTKPFFEDARNV